MSHRLLQKIYALAVLSLLGWPVPHYALSRALGTDPWKNFGLAMYATIFYLEVEVQSRFDGEWRTLPRLEPVLRQEVMRFQQERRTKGLLHRPDDLARRVYERTRAVEVRVVATTRILNGLEGVMQDRRSDAYEYKF